MPNVLLVAAQNAPNNDPRSALRVTGLTAKPDYPNRYRRVQEWECQTRSVEASGVDGGAVRVRCTGSMRYVLVNMSEKDMVVMDVERNEDGDVLAYKNSASLPAGAYRKYRSWAGEKRVVLAGE